LSPAINLSPGVVVTGYNCSPVLLSPAINLSLVSTTPAITENLLQGLIAGVVDSGEQLVSVVDTDDKHSLANISANFQKNSKWPQENTHRPGGH
jgi:hypothetical protein